MKLALLPALLFTSCCGLGPGTQPLTAVEGQEVTRISIHAYPQNKPRSNVTLTKHADIAFVVGHLRDLDSRCYDHSSPQLNLALETSSGNRVNLRVSSLEIGPDAPASAVNRHWFPKDDALYRFLMAKAYPSNPR